MGIHIGLFPLKVLLPFSLVQLKVPENSGEFYCHRRMYWEIMV